MDESKVKRTRDGGFCWTCVVDKEYEEMGYKITVWVCGGLCLFMLGMGVVLGGWDMVKVILMTDLAVMAIVFGVCWAVRKLMGDMKMSYELSEGYITLINVKRYPYSLKRVRTVIVGKNSMLLKGPLFRVKVFMPPEDFTMLKNQILRQIPGSPEVQYMP